MLSLFKNQKKITIPEFLRWYSNQFLFEKIAKGDQFVKDANRFSEHLNLNWDSGKMNTLGNERESAVILGKTYFNFALQFGTEAAFFLCHHIDQSMQGVFSGVIHHIVNSECDDSDSGFYNIKYSTNISRKHNKLVLKHDTRVLRVDTNEISDKIFTIKNTITLLGSHKYEIATDVLLKKNKCLKYPFVEIVKYKEYSYDELKRFLINSAMLEVGGSNNHSNKNVVEMMEAFDQARVSFENYLSSSSRQRNNLSKTLEHQYGEIQMPDAYNDIIVTKENSYGLSHCHRTFDVKIILGSVFDADLREKMLISLYRQAVKNNRYGRRIARRIQRNPVSFLIVQHYYLKSNKEIGSFCKTIFNSGVTICRHEHLKFFLNDCHNEIFTPVFTRFLLLNARTDILNLTELETIMYNFDYIYRSKSLTKKCKAFNCETIINDDGLYDLTKKVFEIKDGREKFSFLCSVYSEKKDFKRAIRCCKKAIEYAKQNGVSPEQEKKMIGMRVFWRKNIRKKVGGE